MEFAHIIETFRDLSVIVIGDAILDVYLDGVTDGLCREAPVPVIGVSAKRNLPGGAANTAVNIARLGAAVTFMTVTGDDRDGVLLRRSLEEQGVPTGEIVTDSARSTLAKNRVFAGSHMLVRFDQGTTERIGPEMERQLIARLRTAFPRCHALIISDYGYGVLTPGITAVIRELQARSPRVIVVDARHPEIYREVGVTAVKPNYGEAAALLGMDTVERTNDRAAQITAGAERILALTGARLAAVTLDAEGALVFERGKPAYRTYARTAAGSRSTGAGDTFASALTLALAAGASTPAAAELASAAAAIVVSKEGTSSCAAIELLGYLSAGDKLIRDHESLAKLASFYHLQGQAIVFTNGCFDVLHRGHITYLNRAKTLGDVLVVGVNADVSVQRLKGGGPANVLEDRMQVLMAMSCVDHVVSFAGDTAEAVIRILRPDIFVKGGDHTRATLPEAGLVESLGGAVHILPYLDDGALAGVAGTRGENE
jgi:D-beta-D-heptose 7-phosphate kinase/D-beta-D-heptose 1-phosphate adenosyltransferase